MIFNYVYNAGLAPANVIADLTKIITGVTDVSTFSASCAKASSGVVVNTKATNWTLHDAVNATTVVFKSLNDDGVTYKYAHFEAALSAPYVVLYSRVYESWNAATHTGTNQAFCISGVSNFVMYLSSTDSFGFKINVTNNWIAMVNSTAQNGHSVMVTELSRENTSLDATYPCVGHMSYNSSLMRDAGNNIIGICRIKYPFGAGDTTQANCQTGNCQYITDIYASPMPLGNTFFNAAGVNTILTLPIVFGLAPQGTSIAGIYGKVVGGVCKIPASSLVVNNNDDLTINGVKYQAVKLTSTVIVLFPWE